MSKDPEGRLIMPSWGWPLQASPIGLGISNCRVLVQKGNPKPRFCQMSPRKHT